MLEDSFPRIWMPSPENRDLRQLLWHRHRLVQMRTRIMNQLQALAMNENKCWKKKLWSERGTSRTRKALVGSLGQSASARVIGAAGPHESDDRGVNHSRRAKKLRKRPEALRLMTHPGVGPLTALAYVLIIGTPNAVCLWQADRQLCGADSERGLQWRQTTVGTHQQARQFFVALLAGGGSTSGRTL